MVALFMAMRSLGLSLCDLMAAATSGWPLLLSRDERRRHVSLVSSKATPADV